MFPDSEGNNFPMSIKDANGPFLIMEATLFGDDKIDNEFKKGSVRPELTFCLNHLFEIAKLSTPCRV